MEQRGQPAQNEIYQFIELFTYDSAPCKRLLLPGGSLNAIIAKGDVSVRIPAVRLAYFVHRLPLAVCPRHRATQPMQVMEAVLVVTHNAQRTPEGQG